MGNPLPQRSLLSRHTRSLLGSILRPDCARSNDRNRKRGQTFIRSIEFLFSIFTRASLDLRSSISISKWTLRPAGNRSIRLNGPIRLFNLDFVWSIEFSFFQSKFYSSNEKWFENTNSYSFVRFTFWLNFIIIEILGSKFFVTRSDPSLIHLTRKRTWKILSRSRLFIFNIDNNSQAFSPPLNRSWIGRERVMVS